MISSRFDMVGGGGDSWWKMGKRREGQRGGGCQGTGTLQTHQVLALGIRPSGLQVVGWAEFNRTCPCATKRNGEMLSCGDSQLAFHFRLCAKITETIACTENKARNGKKLCARERACGKQAKRKIIRQREQTAQETGILRPERKEDVASLHRAREIASRSQSGSEPGTRDREVFEGVLHRIIQG